MLSKFVDGTGLRTVLKKFVMFPRLKFMRPLRCVVVEVVLCVVDVDVEGTGRLSVVDFATRQQTLSAPQMLNALQEMKEMKKIS